MRREGKGQATFDGEEGRLEILSLAAEMEACISSHGYSRAAEDAAALRYAGR